MPQINGDEKYTLYNAGGTKVDGATVAMDPAAGFDYQRATCGVASKAGTWTKSSATAATPGSGGLNGCNKGVFINEFSDAIGTGNYIYEFIELYNDN